MYRPSKIRIQASCPPLGPPPGRSTKCASKTRLLTLMDNWSFSPAGTARRYPLQGTDGMSFHELLMAAVPPRRDKVILAVTLHKVRAS